MKTVHIISHSHLDREWYMPFEAHRMRVVELLDKVLDLFETDADFKYFHVDGHTLPLDDYLEVKPQEKERVQRAIDSGKLRIGPYYILQDAFLISEEANVRNALLGSQELEKWRTEGEKIGYFPDTFGLSGQIPQIVKGTGMSVAAFGRGVKPTGFNNTVSDGGAFQSMYSEMNWESPNGDSVLGILFANWYSNGNEIPTDKAEAKAFWDKKLADVERYSATDHLLMMNGCDHQPVQADVGEAIRVANTLYEDYHFIHSNFTDYINALPQEVLEQLSTVKGELRSQETDGWYTLANTASNRIHIKQRSHALSLRLEQVIEPLSVMAKQFDYRYPQEQIDFAWKLLLQNYPHDSICACSVDAVIHEMHTRFDKVEAILDYLEGELTACLGRHEFAQRPANAEYTFQVWNSTAFNKSGLAVVDIELARCPFSEKRPEACYDTVAKFDFKSWQVIDEMGTIYPAVIEDLGVQFKYDLPKDAFRVPYMGRFARVSLEIPEVAPMSVTQLYLVESDANEEEYKQTIRNLENDYLKVCVEQDGTLSLYDKLNDRQYKGQCIFEETGDSGNEYIFKESIGSRIDSLNTLCEVTYEQTAIEQRMILEYEWLLPISADALLLEEQQRVIDITQRVSGRHTKLIPQKFQVIYSLGYQDRQLRVKITGTNDVKDHRIQLVWTLPQSSDFHLADSHYELVTRSNHVSPEWKNPSNPQVMRHAVSIHNDDDTDTFGLTVSTNGVYEYEVTSSHHDTRLAVTLLRCTGEMGDWGYFPTPDAQCLGEFESELAICLWTSTKQQLESLVDARHHFVPFVTCAPQRLDHLRSDVAQTYYATLFKQTLPKSLVITALKESRYQDGDIIRVVNLGEESVNIADYVHETVQLAPVNLLEQSVSTTADTFEVPHHQIQTYKVIKSL